MWDVAPRDKVLRFAGDPDLDLSNSYTFFGLVPDGTFITISSATCFYLLLLARLSHSHNTYDVALSLLCLLHSQGGNTILGGGLRSVVASGLRSLVAPVYANQLMSVTGVFRHA